MSAIVAKVFRGKREDAVHYGSIAVVDKDGNLTHYVGDPKFFVYTRSSAKPFQLIPLIETGAADKYNFSPKQLSIMCGSHIGTDEHRAVVQTNLETAGNNPENLKCGSHLPIFMMLSGEYPKHNEHLDRVRHNCSGKHSGFLALAKYLGEDIAEYLNPDSKIQQMVLDVIADMYDYPKEKIIVATDGCSAPNFGMPLIQTAIAFMKLADGKNDNSKRAEILKRIRNAMIEYPEMVSGEGRFDLALMRAFPGNIVCKVGAEAVEGIGFTDPPIGMAVKIHDGNQRALYPVCLEVLRQLGILQSADENEHLKSFHQAEIHNYMKILTGRVKAEFDLKKA